MGLYVGEKKRLEAAERADFVELGHSMGLSRRAAETRIDMLRDRVVAAFEAQAADSAIVKSRWRLHTSRKSASISWPWYKGDASALVKLRRRVGCFGQTGRLTLRMHGMHCRIWRGESRFREIGCGIRPAVWGEGDVASRDARVWPSCANAAWTRFALA